MKRILLSAAILCAALHLSTATPASGQALASIAAVGGTGATTAKTAAGCWGCGNGGQGMAVCEGGFVPGYWNCQGGFGTTNNCSLSSPGCGAGASLPLDPDGATQYVSRGAAIGLEAVMAETGTAVKRNCEGVIVARYQTPDNVATVRARTSLLAL
jgi:hypothetical protein